ncbi:hypothetical protein Tco_0626285 [Tanacetum coccineum]|uniref:Uncharacterized protein n=1 Tax=Tanacetum coccineum TaxID=301880 RepID=A0ABQ4WJ65_9ASTR
MNERNRGLNHHYPYITLGKYYSSTTPKVENDDLSHMQSEKATVENIIKQEKLVAAIFSQLKRHRGTVGGLLGSNDGFILGPLLLEIDVMPQVSVILRGANDFMLDEMDRAMDSIETSNTMNGYTNNANE